MMGNGDEASGVAVVKWRERESTCSVDLHENPSVSCCFGGLDSLAVTA